MFDIEVIRVLSILLEVGQSAALLCYCFSLGNGRTWDRSRLPSLQALVLYQVWLFLVIILPPIFYLLGAVMPSWVYGTFLNFSFKGAEYLQIASDAHLLIRCDSCWLERMGHRPIHETPYRGHGETEVSNQRTLFSYQTPNIHWCHSNGLGACSPIPSRSSDHRLYCLPWNSI